MDTQMWTEHSEAVDVLGRAKSRKSKRLPLVEP